MRKSIIMLMLFIPLAASAQKKLLSFSKNDFLIMGLEVAAGYSQGWRDEVQYHPNQLFKQMPNLNRKFWDIRKQDPPGFLNTEWDADHSLKLSTNALHVAAVAFKVGDFKGIKGWNKVWKILIDGAKYYISYKAGFFLAYNITHQNKL